MLIALTGSIVLLQPRAVASDVATLHVATADHAASDSNTGTADAPLKSVTAAVRRAETLTAAGTPVVVSIQPGIYREYVQIGASTTPAALTLQAAAPGVVMSGADVWTEWAPRSDGIWHRPWPYAWGPATLPTSWPAVDPLLLRRELVWIDGRLLRQVLTPEELAARTDGYLVDETAGELLVKAPNGVDLTASLVEVSTRQAVLVANRRHNLTLRGLTFRHAAAPLQRGGVIINASQNLTVEDSLFTHNNWAGLQLNQVDGAVVRRSRANDNGVLGLTVWRGTGLLFEDAETSRNNTSRGAWASFTNWEDGSKLYSTRNVTFRRHTAVENNGPGLWFDTDNVNVVVEDSFLANNTRYGVFAEISQGPLTFRRNRICGNGVVGFMNVKSQDVLVENNEIFGNDKEAIAFSGAPGTVHITDFQTGALIPLRNERFVLRGNVLAQGAARLVRNNLQQEDWDHLKQSLVSDGNQWHSTHAGPFTVPGKWVSFAGWRDDTRQDLASSYSEPSGLTCTSPLTAAPLAPPSPAPSASASPTPSEIASPSASPAAGPATEATPEPTAEATTAPTTGPTAEPTGDATTDAEIGSAVSLVTYSAEWSESLNGKTQERSHEVIATAGQHLAQILLTRGSIVTLEVFDERGLLMGSVTGGSGVSWTGALPDGTYTYVVSGQKSTSYQLAVTVVSA